MYIAGEQFEHDLKLGWAVDHEEQIRLYHASKKACLQGKMDIKSQSIVVYRPQNINYEVKSTASLIGFGIDSQKRYNTIVINGQSRDHAESDSNFQAEFAYSRMSKSPLKINTRAAIKSSAIDFVYSDVIEEPSQSNYHGHVRIQFSPEHQYSSHYVYIIKLNQTESKLTTLLTQFPSSIVDLSPDVASQTIPIRMISTVLATLHHIHEEGDNKLPADVGDDAANMECDYEIDE